MNILVAIDGSEDSDRAVHYAGSTLKNATEVKLTLFHVLRPLPRELLEHGGSENPVVEDQLSTQLRRDQAAWFTSQREAECDILTKALGILARVGFDTKRVVLKFGYEEDVARNVLEEARTGGYSTVVVGRHGSSRKKRFFGGVTDHLLGDCSGLTIWVVTSPASPRVQPHAAPVRP